jgi:CPA2 family monovalent cation:H+ antiporter-2
MSEELNLVKDLAVILIAAGFFTILSKALKQPLILGYIIAGFVVGPHLGLFHITSTEAVSQWSEIGIIFLLFALGLEFSFKKLLKVGTGAMTMVGIIFAGMFVTGVILAQLMNWSMMEGIFLGGLMSMSSTTVIIKAFGDMGLKNKPYASLIFGCLVVEDLIAVVLMVLLSTLATTGKFEGGKVALALARMVFFLVLWFLVGIYVIPTILKKVKKLLNDETLLILAIGLCFTMVAIAESVGFSAALGAFVMGSILAETLEGERIEHLLTNIKDLFGAIFFVSVGMMVDPVVIGQKWGTILVIAIAAVAGLLVFATTGALVAGNGLDVAVHSGFSMAQLGEFAFIIASVGCSKGVLREFIYPVIIAVSVITTFTAPYMIKAGDPVSKWLQKVLPKSFLDKVNSSSADDYKPRSKTEASDWKTYIKSYAMRVGLYLVLLLAIFFASRSFLGPGIDRWLPSWSQTARSLVVTLITLVVMAPFLYGMTSSNRSMNSDIQTLIKDRHSNIWTIMSLDLIRIFIAIAIVITVITSHFVLSWAVILLLAVTIILSAIPLRRLMRKHVHLEERFFSNLEATDKRDRQRAPVTTTVRENLEKYNVHIEDVILSPDSQYVGKALKDLPFRGEAGVNIIKIARGSKSITIPSADAKVYPFDRLLAVGTEAQLQVFRDLMKDEITAVQPVIPGALSPEDESFVVRPVEILEGSPMFGKSLRALKMRSRGCMAICVLRDGALITNPSPDEPFRSGDLVWLAGENASIASVTEREA